MVLKYSPDFSRDIDVLHGLQTMTLKVQDQSDVLLAECVQRHPTMIREFEPSDAQVPQQDLEFTWAVYRTPDQPPLGSCLVEEDVDGGAYWTILAIRRIEITKTWNAKCRNLALIPATINTATLLRGIAGKGKANEVAWSWVGAISGESPVTADDTIQARFQPANEIAQIRFGGEWAKSMYRLITEKALPQELARAECRIVDGSGNRYRMLDCTGEQRIDRFPIATIVRITEGREYTGAGTPQPLPPPTFPTA